MPEKGAPKHVLGTPRGTRDLGFKDAIALNEILDVVEEVFKRFGFSPIDTPSIENMDVINAKAYGEESTKEIYVIEGGEAGLRYDLTVPMARFVAMNKDLPLPFKRYHIGKTWRKDEPQFMRAREFIQADIDIVGSKELDSDAEVICGTAAALEALGIKNYTILLNNREILDAVLGIFSVPKDRYQGVKRIIDKLPKQSVDDTIKQLVELGVEKGSAEKMLGFMNQPSANDKKLSELSVNAPAAKAHIESAGRLLELIKQYGLSGEVKIDLSLARGLDYYTGFVWEFIVYEEGKRMPSIAGGGRYDNLISLYSKSSMPAVGSSIGINRILELFKSKTPKKSYVKAFIAQIGEESREYSLSVAKLLRSNGIYTDINLTTRGISKQLEYANAIGAEYVIVIGSQEKAAKKAKLKNMTTGEEQLLDLNGLISVLKGA